MESANQGSFLRRLNLFDSTAIVVGSMIGSGIFIVTADMARSLGSPGWILLVWIITGLLTIIAALSYGELAALMPKAGGQYVYLREAYNPLTGFLYGWTLLLVIQTGTIAAVAMAFAKFTGVLLPWFSENHILIQILGIDMEMPGIVKAIAPSYAANHPVLGLFYFKLSSAQVLAIMSIVFLSWNNSRGIKIGKLVQNAFTTSKVAILLIFILVGLIFATNKDAVDLNNRWFWTPASGDLNHNVPLYGWALIVAMGSAMVGSLFSSDAWNNITFTSEEVKKPARTIALSLFLGTLIVTILYLLVNWVYFRTLPARGLQDGASVMERGIQYATQDRLGTASLQGLFGGYAALIMAAFVVISTFGCNNGLTLAGSRAYYAMAKDGLLFRSVAVLNDRGVPANGLWLQAVWASMLCLSGSYSELLDYVIFAVLIFYVLTILAVFILRRKRPDAERPYKAFGYPVLPALYILISCLIMVILLIYKSKFTWPGLIIVIFGIPVYYFWRKKTASPETITPPDKP